MTQRVMLPSSVQSYHNRWSVPGHHTCSTRPRRAPQIHYRHQAGLRTGQQPCRHSCKRRAASPEHADLQTEEAAEQVSCAAACGHAQPCTPHRLSTRTGPAGVQQRAGGRGCSILRRCAAERIQVDVLHSGARHCARHHVCGARCGQDLPILAAAQLAAQALHLRPACMLT